MHVLAAESIQDIELIRPLLDEMAQKTDNESFGLPPVNVDRTVANLTALLDMNHAVVLVLVENGCVAGVLALVAILGVATEKCFYLRDFSHTRPLIDAGKRWAAAARCTALQITSSNVEEGKRQRVFNLLHKRGSFEKYAEVYMVRL